MTGNVKTTKTTSINTEIDICIHFNDCVDYAVFCDAIDAAYSAYQLANSNRISQQIANGILHDPYDDCLFKLRLLTKKIELE